MIQSLEIKRFKSIAEETFKLGNVNLFIGANNSGKSTVLQAVHFAVSIAQSTKLLGKKSTIASQQILYAPLNDVASLGSNGLLTQSKDKAIEISFTFRNGNNVSVEIRRGKNANLSTQLKGNLSLIEDIDKPFSIYVPGLAGLAKTETYITKGLLRRALARGDANLFLRNVLFHLREDESGQKKWDSFVNELKKVFHDVDIEITYDHETDEYINVQIVRGGFSLPIDAAGTGLLQTIQILSYYFLFKPTVMLLDEPDSHLHPNNQRALARLLIEISENGNTQILIATHSRHILDAFTNDATKIWMGQGKSRDYTESLEVLVDLGALDSAEGLLAQGVKYVILSEDEDKNKISDFISSMIPSTEFMVWSYKGCTKIDTASALAKFIQQVSLTTKIIVHRDSDYLEDDYKKKISEDYNRFNTSVFFTSGVDIEVYYCRLEHLKALNSGHEEFVNAAYQKAKEESISEFRRIAKEGKKQVRNQRNKEGLSTESIDACDSWVNSISFDEERWIHGKTLLKAIRRIFRENTGRNLIVTKASQFLVDPNLKQMLGV